MVLSDKADTGQPLFGSVLRTDDGGRTWVRMTLSDSEYYIDVENSGDRIGRIECVDPLVAYWLARRTDKYPVMLED